MSFLIFSPQSGPSYQPVIYPGKRFDISLTFPHQTEHLWVVSMNSYMLHDCKSPALDFSIIMTRSELRWKNSSNTLQTPPRVAPWRLTEFLWDRSHLHYGRITSYHALHLSFNYKFLLYLTIRSLKESVTRSWCWVFPAKCVALPPPGPGVTNICPDRVRTLAEWRVFYWLPRGASSLREGP